MIATLGYALGALALAGAVWVVFTFNRAASRKNDS